MGANHETAGGYGIRPYNGHDPKGGLQMNPQTTCGADVPEAFATLMPTIAENRGMLDALFADVDIMLHREFQNAENPSLRFCVYFSDGVSDSMLIGEEVIKPLILASNLPQAPGLYPAVRDHAALVGDMKETQDMQEIVEAITYGDTLLLVEGSDTGILISSKNFNLRGISEPEGEKVLLGPREGFNEGIMTNLSMLRRRLRTHHLKLKLDKLGRQTKTGICIAYLDNIVNPALLDELMGRLEEIDIDGVLDSEYIAEFIAEGSALGFRTIGATERPDVIAGRLLEGRIALFVDGSPVVLTLPYLFVENFHSSEDYYMGNLYATYARLLRMMSFFFAITVPAFFIVIVGYHHELLPTGLMFSFATARQNVPLPAAIECFLMLLLFDILRETGIRTPGYVGQAVGFVGGIVIGQSAVEANLVAAPMVIVVAFAGICIIMVPRLTMASLVARYGTLLMASLFGLPGFILALFVVTVHVLSLRSFSVPMCLTADKLGQTMGQDGIMRTPWPKMVTRLAPLSENRVRVRPKPADSDGGTEDA